MSRPAVVRVFRSALDPALSDFTPDVLSLAVVVERHSGSWARRSARRAAKAAAWLRRLIPSLAKRFET